MVESIGEIVRKAETNYTTGTTTISKYVEFDQYENINKIDAYLNSRHTTGSQDALGRDKPFFNIVTAAVNIWYRATNIARNKIRLKATSYKQYVITFLGTIHIQEWMRREAFEAFLDEWGRTLAKYGSALLKFVEKDGKLVPSVIPWSRIICDPVQFEGNVVIEKLEYTPAQLRKTDYDKETVDRLIDSKDVRKTLDKQNRDTKEDYITLYEVHGELPLALLTDNEDDEDTYVQQMHVISFVESNSPGKSEYEDYSLYKGREKNPYMMTHLIKEDNRTQAIGAVEYLFDAQWMVNHSMKLIKDQLDLASQLIFQTADSSYVGRNVLSSIMSGDILVHKENLPLTQLANSSHDITALQNFSAQWQVLGKDITSTPDAIRGNTQPSGTAFRSVMIQNKEANSLFEVMTRNKKRYIEEMIRRFVIPHIKKQMDTTEEVAATLESQDITRLDALYVPSEAIRRDNAQIKRAILSGQIAQNLDKSVLEGQVREELSQQGNQRFIKPSDVPSKTWKQVLKDLEWEVEVDIQDKATDEQVVGQILLDLFKTIAEPAYQQVLQTPQGKMLFNKLLEHTNAVSPIEMAQVPQMIPQLAQPLIK